VECYILYASAYECYDDVIAFNICFQSKVSWCST